jgi:hypothetical protein
MPNRTRKGWSETGRMEALPRRQISRRKKRRGGFIENDRKPREVAGEFTYNYRVSVSAGRELAEYDGWWWMRQKHERRWCGDQERTTREVKRRRWLAVESGININLGNLHAVTRRLANCPLALLSLVRCRPSNWTARAGNVGVDPRQDIGTGIILLIIPFQQPSDGCLSSTTPIPPPTSVRYQQDATRVQEPI